ncbi:molybdenum cofactor guanylyltransferase [Kutzneria viridogrisea]|uniref:Molybdopterin-guanine dinucleotide biosynthesis protein A n=1 Tax=Kutzneria viridogrisea TaxID=47990 RepID=A0ABR6BNF1_9PSEU|nr:molybdopterin-guanine dinucleotide biosynthesis protein A [Kutzneria viridogrisea]
MTFAAVVLAGGGGRRLGGVHKPGLLVGGRTLLDRALHAVPGADPIVVVGPRTPTGTPVTWAREDPPGGGPVAGLAAGLALVGDAEFVAVLAADLAGIRPGTVARLRAAVSPQADGAVLVDEQGHPQWLIGCWRTGSLRAALPADPAGRPLRSVLGGLALARVAAEPGESSDVDTVEDLERHRDAP